MMPYGHLYLYKEIKNTRDGNYLVKYHSFLFKVKIMAMQCEFYSCVSKIYDNRSTNSGRSKRKDTTVSSILYSIYMLYSIHIVYNKKSHI